MKKRTLQVKIMFAEPKHDPSSESESDGESVSDVLNELKMRMKEINNISKSIDSHIIDLYKRAKSETVDWMNEPLKPRSHIKKWCSLHGLSDNPTMDEFIEACLDAAWKTDLDSRMLTFKNEDAAILWNGTRRVTIFEIIRLVPTLFE